MTTNSTPFALRLDWARSLFDHGDFSAAATALRELVDESATAEHLHGTADLRLLLARAYFGSAQLGRAETVLRALVEEAPDDGYLHLLLGRTLQRQASARRRPAPPRPRRGAGRLRAPRRLR